MLKVFRFFIRKIFFRKAIIVFSTLMLLFLCNYLLFTAARSIVSTFQGYDEMKHLNQRDSFIANLDPGSDINFDKFDETNIQNVYEYLNENFNYALFTDGYMVSLPNSHDMEVSFAYLNEEYYKINDQFDISQGKTLDFDYNLDDNVEIPILIGKGLSETYPLGSKIEIEDPVLYKPVVLKVQGILKQNVHHSNFYALNSKQYYNFSIIIPINEEFINNSSIELQLHGLFDMILLQTSQVEIENFAEVINDNLGMKFNFYTQQENFDYFNEYYYSSLRFIVVITTISTVILTCITIWNSLTSINLMIKDFTINLFVGLTYSKLRMIFYGYYGILFVINWFILFVITAYSRYGNWIRKDALFSTFGLFGLINIDWLSLLVVIVFDIIIGIIIVEIMLFRIKKVPISLGVLQ